MVWWSLRIIRKKVHNKEFQVKEVQEDDEEHRDEEEVQEDGEELL